MGYFLMSQVLLNPKSMFLGHKMCPVASTQTDRHTDRQSDYCGHPFKVSGIFPSSKKGPICGLKI